MKIREIRNVSATIVLSLGLIARIFLGQDTMAANNPADLTNGYRQIPLMVFKGSYDVDKTKWGFASFPLGIEKDNSAYIFGKTDEENNTQLLRTGIVTERGDLDLGFQIKNTWSDEANSQPEFTAIIDFDLDYGGLGGLVDINNLGQTQVGGRLNIRDFKAYIRTELEASEPRFGLSYDGKITVDFAYEPGTETYFVRTSKGIRTKVGTIVPELRFKADRNGQFIGFGIIYVPGRKSGSHPGN